jgi:glycosyltransferase involved in cell wall biosynthesis
MLDYDSMKLTFGVGICFYNDRRSLRRCVESVYGNVDYILAIDGKYSYNDWNTSELSDDGSREYIRDIASSFEGQGLFMIDSPNLTEYAKRQIYVDLTKDYGIDVLLILDSDEYVYSCDWIKFRHECYQKMIVRDKMRWQIYNVAFREPMDRPRLWFQAWKIRIGPTHYDFCLKDDPTCKEINLGGDAMHTVGNMVISHKHDLRTADHQFAREQWEKKQQSLEDAHRLELREKMIKRQ